MCWFADHVVRGTVSRGWEECWFWDLKIDPVSTELFTPETVPALCENEGESVAQLSQKEHSVFSNGVMKWLLQLQTVSCNAGPVMVLGLCSRIMWFNYTTDLAVASRILAWAFCNIFLPCFAQRIFKEFLCKICYYACASLLKQFVLFY